MSKFASTLADFVKTALFEPEVNINKADVTTGRIFWVMKTSDAGYVDFCKRHPNYEDGVAAVYTTIELAYAAMVTNRNDVTMLSSHGGHAVAAMLDVSKNRCHFMSIDVQRGRHYGARSRITMGVTTVATDIAVVKNTGVGNTFKGLKFDNGNTKDESLYAFAEGGEYTYFENCEFYLSGQLDDTDAADLLLNGDSAQFKNCMFGSAVHIVADDKIRPCIMLARETITGKVARDCYFENCLFLRNAGGTETAHVWATGATDVERMLMFKDCTFFNTKLAAAQPAVAVGAGAAQTEGYIFLKSCSSVYCTLMVQAAVGIYVDGAAPAFATSGVAVAS